MSAESSPRRAARPRRGAFAVLGAGLLLAACSDGPNEPGKEIPPVVVPGPKVGDILTLNTQANSACGSIANRGGRIAAISDKAIVVADTGNPAGGFTDAEYASIGATFDTLVYPVDVRHFGAPADIDKNGKVIIFYTQAVNRLTPADVQYIIGGFFIARDLFPKTAQPGFQACAGSNQGELFYLLVPDPAGSINRNPRSKADVLRSSVATVAHEFQHLINASRRLYVLNQQDYYEEVWLNEGLSHVAEEATFYQAAGLSPSGAPGDSPRGDLGSAAFPSGSRPFNALNEYNVSNLGRISSYLKAVQDSTPLGLAVTERGEPDDDGLATRGAIWAFLRYAADRTGSGGADFTQKLVSGSTLGLANLRTATGAGAALADWFRDWAVANYADNYAAPALDARFQYASWNFRTLLPRLTSNNNSYPLVVRTLANGAARSDSVAGGSAAYYTFSLAGGASAPLRTRDVSGAAPGAAVRLSLVRVTTADAAGGPAVTTYEAGQGADITVANPSGSTAQYGLVVFNSSLDNPRAKQTVTVTVTGASSGAVVASAPRDAQLRASRQPGPTIEALRTPAEGGFTTTDAPLQERFREMARDELAPRVAGAQAWYRARMRQ